MIADDIAEALEADLSVDAVAAFFRSLKGMTSQNMHIATDAILHCIRQNPNAFSHDEASASKLLRSLYDHPFDCECSTVGTRLQKIIARMIPAMMLRKLDKSRCQCEEIESKCNAWGIAGCIDNESFIVAHLAEQSKRLAFFAASIPKAIREDAARKMLRLAIRQERKFGRIDDSVQ